MIDPLPFPRGLLLTAAIELDCRTVPLDPFYAHSTARHDGRADGLGKVAGYRCASRFGREGQSRHPFDTRSVRSIPPGLKCFEPGWSLEHKTQGVSPCGEV